MQVHEDGGTHVKYTEISFFCTYRHNLWAVQFPISYNV